MHTYLSHRNYVYKPIESCSVPISQEASQNIEPNFWKYMAQRLWSSGQSTSCDVCRRTFTSSNPVTDKTCNLNGEKYREDPLFTKFGLCATSPREFRGYQNKKRSYGSAGIITTREK